MPSACPCLGLHKCRTNTYFETRVSSMHLLYCRSLWLCPSSRALPALHPAATAGVIQGAHLPESSPCRYPSRNELVRPPNGHRNSIPHILHYRRCPQSLRCPWPPRNTMIAWRCCKHCPCRAPTLDGMPPNLGDASARGRPCPPAANVANAHHYIHSACSPLPRACPRISRGCPEVSG